MPNEKELNFDLPKGSDIVDFLIVNKLAPSSWNGLKSLTKFSGRDRLRKKLRQIIYDNAEDVPADWVTSTEDVWDNPRMDILHNETHVSPVLPMELFGEFWAKVISENAKAKSTAKDYIALALLVVGASLIGNARTGAPTPEWTEATVLWGANIGSPGAGKTQAIDAVIDYLKSTENRYDKEYKEAIEEWKKECERLTNGEKNENHEEQ